MMTTTSGGACPQHDQVFKSRQLLACRRSALGHFAVADCLPTIVDKMTALVAHRASSAPATLDKSPHEQDEYRAHNRSNETGLLIRSIPADSLSKVTRYKGTNNPEDSREYETLGFVVARGDELSDDACNKADDDDPKNMHVLRPSSNLPCK
jgi:hypothetical protein